nr:DEAD/DEAH box helicase [Cellulomonas sp. APG4]
MVDGQRRRPQPTLVTTGTGSGKTEAFLYPILDHVLRARRDGVTGTKALILYPMNALANDQALRLTQLLTTKSDLAGITAALYTGQAGPTRTSVTADGLITDRAVIRDSAPDILLTNYKMLDQLLLRRDDQDLWRQSATSLQYLVLDEFHTYDGAQGTDVAMLLRRLGLTLKSHWTDDATGTDEDRARPLGRITPVATSATLGDKGDPTVMVDFARTVFGEEFGPDSVVTESRLSLEEWAADAPARTRAVGLTPRATSEIDPAAVLEAVEALGHDPSSSALAHVVVQHLFSGDEAALSAVTGAGPDTGLLLDAARSHPLVHALAGAAAEAVPVERLVEAVLGRPPAGRDDPWGQVLSHVVAMLGHVRALTGRDALSVDVHLWVRELSRIDRAADSTTQYRWADDGPASPVAETGDLRPPFPALYCRHCGRSGWGVELAPGGGWDLASSDEKVRVNHLTREGRFRALLYAPVEADRAFFGEGDPPEGLVWFSVRGRTLLQEMPAEDDPELRDGWVLPVLTTVGPDADKAAKDDDCPSCGQADGIRFLGSAIATLLSVSLSTLFGSAQLDAREKKALVFTDSVQDAAHRAGFVQARSHTLTLRAVLREAVDDGPLTLDALVDEVIRRAGDDAFARYRIISPDCADREAFRPFWQAPTLRGVSTSVRKRVHRRLAFDAAMELGLNSRTGRTLELTGAVAAEVQVHPERMAKAARTVLSGFALLGTLDGGSDEPGDRVLVQWVRGVLDRMRAQGAIDHEWFARYRAEDGARWTIWGGRPRGQGMPAFPRGRPAPEYPRVGGAQDAAKESGLAAVTSAKSWYARWTSRVLPVSPQDGGLLARLLLDRLAKDGVLVETTTQSGGTVYAIPPSSVVVSPTDDDALRAGQHMLTCDVCRAVTPGSPTVVAELADAPCLAVRCTGRLRPAPVGDGFYRRLYSSPDMRRVVAREHTSLLDDETRLAYENGFKGAQDDPQAPNVLVATPTLEMGIDIGDLSAVFLASLPRTVASYLQRVGRAGRLTGNALSLAYVTGRGEHLPKLGDPLSVINGEVRPPATYLDAEEILRRQYTAHLVDHLARDSSRTHPRRATHAIGSIEPGSFLGDLIELAESGTDEHLSQFAASLDGVGDAALVGLRAWATPQDGPGSSGLAAHLHAASRRWQGTVETLGHRITAIDAVLPELQRQADSPAATDDDKRALRSAQTARRLTEGQQRHLRGEHWIAVLEEYGILPNYTLLDDTVTLDVGLSWTDPDTDTFQTAHVGFVRGAAQAIREFAPGATFYARGLEIGVDAVDLGIDGESIRPWAFCPACGYAVDVEATGAAVHLSKCPRCGSAGIADTGQRVDVVELTHATAEVRRDEATINDRKDTRDNARFQVFMAADVDPEHIRHRWFTEGVGLGCTYLTAMNLRWINAGVPGHGTTRTIAGEDRPAALFRLCAGCGKLDSDTGRNTRHEHRPWCQYRDSLEENTRSVALTRTLRTQGLLLRLPRTVTVGDAFALPSLSAALLLGLREQMGGHPDHLQVAHVVDPTYSDGSANHDGLLLHDIVPGGTGYLAELATPERLHALLARAWRHVRDCECSAEERLACHRCLLPFAAPHAVGQVSRAVAERHLRALLGITDDATDVDTMTWTVTDEAPDDTDPESYLEQRFRKMVLERLSTLGAAVTETPGPWGNTLTFTLPSSQRRWTLRPQANLVTCRPDFLLESNDTNVPRIAVFVDGRRFHAVPAVNRLRDDATKRADLRAAGYVVVGVTSADLDAAEHQQPDPPSWYDENAVGHLITRPALMASPSAYAALADGPLARLLAWIQEPDAAHRRITARAVPFFLTQGAQALTVADSVPLAHVAAARLRDQQPPSGTRRVAVWRHGALVAAIEPRGPVIDVAVVLDDRDESLDDGHAEAWRAWLRLSNVLALRDWPTVITTLTLVDAEQGGGASLPTPATESQPEQAAPATIDVSWPRAWREAAQAATAGPERDLVQALASRKGLTGSVEAPAVGVEGPDGIMVDLAWPTRRIAVEVAPMADEDRADLVSAGWQVLDPDVDMIAQVLRDAERTDEQEADA